MGAYKYFVVKDMPYAEKEGSHVKFNTWMCPFRNLEDDDCQASEEFITCPNMSGEMMKVPEKCPLRHGRIVVKLEGRD